MPGDRPPEGEETGTACRNCGTDLQGTYCHTCGQRDRGGSITFRELGAYLVENLLEMRRGFLYTLWQVACRPGDVARRYVTGERKTFVNPLTLFLVVATAVFLAYGFAEDAMVEYLMQSSRLSIPDAAFQDSEFQEIFGVTSRQAYGERVFAWLRRIYSYVGLGYCLMVAVAYRLFFSSRTVAENLVFELFVITQANLFSTAVVVGLTALGITSPLLIGSGFVLTVLLHLPAGRAYFDGTWKEGLLTMIGFLAGYVLFLLVTVALTFTGGVLYGVLRAGGG